MKYSVLIIADRRNPGLLSYVTGGLFQRGIFPELFSSETIGAHTVRLRLQLECAEDEMAALREFWEITLRVQSVITSPLLPADGPVPVAYAAPATALD